MMIKMRLLQSTLIYLNLFLESFVRDPQKLQNCVYMISGITLVQVSAGPSAKIAGFNMGSFV